ncbi:hypothetical protein LTS18_009309, partial [Coniosporium uncinatum]
MDRSNIPFSGDIDTAWPVSTAAEFIQAAPTLESYDHPNWEAFMRWDPSSQAQSSSPRQFNDLDVAGHSGPQQAPTLANRRSSSNVSAHPHRHSNDGSPRLPMAARSNSAFAFGAGSQNPDVFQFTGQTHGQPLPPDSAPTYNSAVAAWDFGPALQAGSNAYYSHAEHDPHYSAPQARHPPPP